VGENMDFVTYLQGEGKHGINVLLALHALTKKAEQEGKPTLIGWSAVKKWINENMHTSITDGTYRNRINELSKMGFVEIHPVDKLRNRVTLTSEGIHYAEMLAEFIEKVKAAESKK
jgi:hypothetical protein